MGKKEPVNGMYQILITGKEGLDGFVQELGVMLVQAIMDMEWEERFGTVREKSSGTGAARCRRDS